MTAYVPAASIIGSSIVYASVAVNDSVTFLQPYAFINTNTNAVNLLHANNTVLNMTTLLSGGTYGLVVNSVADCDIINTATGTIATLSGFFGYSAIYMAGDRNTLLNAGNVYSVNGTGVVMDGDDNSIDNSGSIRGYDFGISASGSDYTIRNSGTIEAGSAASPVAVNMSGTGASKILSNTGVIQSLSPAAGIAVQVAGANVTTISNAGTILSAGGAAIDASPSTGTLRLTNSGTIASLAATALAVVGTALGDSIVNRGSIEGDILMGAGNDHFDGRLGDLIGQVLGGTGDDTFTISDAATEIVELAGGGADTVRSTVSYTLGDMIEMLTMLGHGDLAGRGNAIANTIIGNDGDNRIAALAGNDTITAGGGDDVIDGGEGKDTLNGDDGVDILVGGIGDDRAYGGDGDDRVSGGDGVDVLIAGAGDDRVDGGAGNDRVYGGNGNDVSIGGAGFDAFSFSNPLEGNDRIDDWVAVGDQIGVDASAFGGGLAAGALAANRLVVGGAPVANQAFGQFLFNTVTGQLSWDADGTGVGAAVLLARLYNGGISVTTLAAGDFDVVA